MIYSDCWVVKNSYISFSFLFFGSFFFKLFSLFFPSLVSVLPFLICLPERVFNGLSGCCRINVFDGLVGHLVLSLIDLFASSLTHLRWSLKQSMRFFSAVLMAVCHSLVKVGSSWSRTCGVTFIFSLAGVCRLLMASDRASKWLEALSSTSVLSL